jgi:(2R)-ethylmalonyl-CoA mutase
MNKSLEVIIWGSGSPMREFLYVDDMAAASVYVMNLDKSIYDQYTEPMLSHINVGFGSDVTIKQLAQTISEVETWRSARDNAAVEAALAELRRVALTDENIMGATIALAVAGGTTGEWAGALREVFGEYRAPTGVAAAAGVGTMPEDLRAVAERVKTMAGGPPRFLVGKPGLDGHSNGAEQIAVAARDAGMEVIYQGIRLTPTQIAAVARDEDVDVVGLSILSGSHMQLVPDVVERLRAEGVTCPVIVGGIIPEDDRPKLLAAGVARVYTPKDFELGHIMSDIAALVAETRS